MEIVLFEPLEKPIEYTDRNGKRLFHSFADLLRMLQTEYEMYVSNNSSMYECPVRVEVRRSSSRLIDGKVDFKADYKIISYHPHTVHEQIEISVEGLTGLFITNLGNVSIPSRLFEYLLHLSRSGIYTDWSTKYDYEQYLERLTNPNHWTSNHYDLDGKYMGSKK